jgi:hypothetical protein
MFALALTLKTGIVKTVADRMKNFNRSAPAST